MVDTATGTDPNVDFTLEDESGNKYGFVVVDGNGIRNFQGFKADPLPQTPFKMTAGEMEHSDFEFPYIQAGQKDWSEGGGQETFENNRRKFYTSWALNTWMDGRIILAPREFYATGHRKSLQDLPGDMWWEDMLNVAAWKTRFISRTVTVPAGGGFTTAGVSFWIRGDDGDGSTAPLGDLTIELQSDDGGGKPSGTALASATFAASDYIDTEREFTSILVELEWDTPVALSAGTTYHIVWDGGAAPTSNNGLYGRWALGVDLGGTDSFISIDGSTWVTSDNGGASSFTFDPWFRLWDAELPFSGRLVEYKHAIYLIAVYDDGTTPKIFRNGYRGVATGTQSATTLKDTTQSWDTNELAGKVIYLDSGTGQFQARKITSNTADTITVPTWDTTPVAASTTYVIQGTDTWVEVTGHTLTGPIKDAMVQNDILFVTQGSSVATMAFRAINNSGTYEDIGTTNNTRYALPTSNPDARGDFLAKPMHSEHGELIVISQGNDSLLGAKIQGWGVNPPFKFQTKIGDSGSRITGISTGATDRGKMIVFKENGIWTGGNEGFKQFPIDGMEKVASADNGAANLVQGEFVFFSFLHSVHRLHLDSKNIDPIGPDEGTGLPDYRRGVIRDFVGYPGLIIAAVDAGDNYSSIMVYNNAGWHTLYKSHTAGRRIRNLTYQHIDNEDVPDRLFATCGSDILAFDFPSGTFDPEKDTNYRYTHEGVIDLSYVKGGLEDLEKTFATLKYFARGMSGGNLLVNPPDRRQIYHVHRQDADTSWTAYGDMTGANISNLAGGSILFMSRTLANSVAITGYSNQSRLIIQSDQTLKTPVLTAIVTKLIAFLTEKYAYTALVRIQDEGIDLQGDETANDANTVITQLQDWMGAAKRLTFNHRMADANWRSKYVYLYPAPLIPFKTIKDDEIEGFLLSITLIDATET